MTSSAKWYHDQQTKIPLEQVELGDASGWASRSRVNSIITSPAATESQVDNDVVSTKVTQNREDGRRLTPIAGVHGGAVGGDVRRC